MIEYVHNLIHWDQYKDDIKRALDKGCGEIEIQDVYKKLQDGTMGLIDIHGKASCVVEFVDYDQMEALRVVALGGDGMDEWLEELLDFLYKWAAENHMDRVEHNGRKGWVRKLEKYGYRERYIFMTRDIEYGEAHG